MLGPQGTAFNLGTEQLQATGCVIDTLTRQLDGSYLVEIDSRALDPSLTIAQFVLAAADGAGNRSSSSAEFPLTRVALPLRQKSSSCSSGMFP